MSDPTIVDPSLLQLTTLGIQTLPTDGVTAVGGQPATQPADTPAGFVDAAYQSGAINSPYLMAPTTGAIAIPASVLSAPAGSQTLLGNVENDISSWWQSSIINPKHDIAMVGATIDRATASATQTISTAGSYLKWAVVGLVAFAVIKLLGIFSL